MAFVALAGIASAGLLASGPAFAESEKGARGGMPSSGSGSPDSSGTSDDSSTDDLVEPLDIEGWIGGAYRGMEDEVYCEVSDDYGEGTVLYVGWDDLGFYVLIEDPQNLQLEEFSEFDTEITIDDFYRRTIEAFALDVGLLDLTFGDDPEAVQAFRKGVKLTLEQWGTWYTLYGLGKAIPALEACYWRHNS
ncbi:MAG: hypothetical protein AB7V53_15110 [Dongiaceae bacterium]